ncbi:hypothetical protein L8106_30475, partial [Lyngbya sp. PCC 8106]
GLLRLSLLSWAKLNAEVADFFREG